MSVETQQSPGNRPIHPTSRPEQLAGTFLRLFALVYAPLGAIGRLIRTYPGLTLLAALMFATVGGLKLMSFRAIAREVAIERWIEANGGSCYSYEVAGHTVLLFLNVMVDNDIPSDGAMSAVVVPAELVRAHPERLFRQLSQLPKLTTIRFKFDGESPETVSTAASQSGSANKTTPKDNTTVNTIDSERLQRGLASLPHGVSLAIQGCRLTPCAQPLDLTHRLNGLTLEQVHLTSEFALGLPVLNRRPVTIVDSRIDDAAVDILFKRLQSDDLQLYRCQMSEQTKLRLAEINGVLVDSPYIVTINGIADSSPTSVDETAAVPVELTTPAE